MFNDNAKEFNRDDITPDRAGHTMTITISSLTLELETAFTIMIYNIHTK